MNASIASLDNLKLRQPEVTLSPIPDTPDSEVPAGQNQLQITVSADSWVEISDANGQSLEMDLLRAGSTKTYQGEPPFKFVFGRASAVKLSMDGEAVDLAPFTKADVVQMSWPQLLQAESENPDQN